MKLQVSIAGYAGNPVTLVGIYDDDNGVLVIAKQVAYREGKAGEDFALVSNLDLAETDYKFVEDDLKTAIQSYFTMKAQGMVDIVEGLQRFQPDNRIESDAIDAAGRKYRISPDIDCGQIGVLAMVCYVAKQRGIFSAIDAAKELADFTQIMTI